MLFFSNQMGKTHSKPLASRHGRGTAWAMHAMCESALRVKEAGEKGVDWIYQGQDRDTWQPLVNTPMNVRIPLLDPETRLQIIENNSAFWR
jgi:demethoxyubiquinone hydroxylase (CLK1/Coq7/Cat5 family)